MTSLAKRQLFSPESCCSVVRSRGNKKQLLTKFKMIIINTLIQAAVTVVMMLAFCVITCFVSPSVVLASF